MKKIKILFIILALILTLFACKEVTEEPPQSINMLFTGDVSGASQSPDISGIGKRAFTYQKDGAEISAEGYRLDEIVGLLDILDSESWLMITASDNTTARINIENADLCYVIHEESKFNIRAPELPPVAGIRDIAEITVVARNAPQNGVSFVTQDDKEVRSLGQIRMSFFEQTAENRKNDIPAYKHALKAEMKISDITDEHMNMLYFDNFDIIKTGGEGHMLWQQGKLGYEQDNKQYFGLKGIVSGTEKLISDAYYDIKAAIDEDERVMFILPDGLSLEQVEHFYDDLSLFKQGYEVASSVNPAISNVALATLVTGVSPYHTGITERGIKAPAQQDIFAYAAQKGKSVSYIEGNGNLILTSVEPVLNLPDAEGYTDNNVYNSAVDALEETDFLFVHFHGIDDVNHEYSPLSVEAKTKILEVEGYIESLVEDFDGTVIIVPDHGSVTVTNGDETEGKHGLFLNGDMFVPYYVITRESA